MSGFCTWLCSVSGCDKPNTVAVAVICHWFACSQLSLVNKMYNNQFILAAALKVTVHYGLARYSASLIKHTVPWPKPEMGLYQTRHNHMVKTWEQHNGPPDKNTDWGGGDNTAAAELLQPFWLWLGQAESWTTAWLYRILSWRSTGCRSAGGEADGLWSLPLSFIWSYRSYPLFTQLCLHSRNWKCLNISSDFCVFFGSAAKPCKLLWFRI